MQVGSTVTTIFTYDINTIVQSTSSITCGVPVIEWSYSNGNELDVIFIDNRSITGSFSLAVVGSIDITWVGEYDIYFSFYYSQQPSVFVHSVIFTVIIINPCIPPPLCWQIPGCGVYPPTLTPPTIDIDINVTISVSTSITIPSWDCGSPLCQNQIIIDCFDCNIGGQTDVVVIIENTITINIENCGTICTQNPGGTTVIIVIQGCLGTVCVPIDVPVVIYNPCLDPNYFTIQPVALPEIQYVLYQTGVSVSHQPFPVNATPDLINICGSLVYTITCDLDVYITYDVTTHVIIIYCEDMDLIATGTFEYTITVSLSIYTSVTVSSGGTIIILDPCEEANCQMTTSEVQDITIDYGNSVTFNFPTLTVEPTVCGTDIVYTCQFIQGPYMGGMNLCNFNFLNGSYSSQATFNVQTGSWTFVTSDIATFPPGNYIFRIFASNG